MPLRRGARSRKMPSRITSRAVLKSSTHSQPLLTSPRSAVAAKSLAVNKLLLVGRKLKRFFPTLGTFVAKVSMYNTHPYGPFFNIFNKKRFKSSPISRFFKSYIRPGQEKLLGAGKGTRRLMQHAKWARHVHSLCLDRSLLYVMGHDCLLAPQSLCQTDWREGLQRGLQRCSRMQRLKRHDPTA